jgi:prostaglandin-E synthase
LQETEKIVGVKDISYVLKKADRRWWPRLLKKEGTPPVFLKIDSVGI